MRVEITHHLEQGWTSGAGVFVCPEAMSTKLMSSQNNPETIYLKDYSPANFLIDRVELRFELGEDKSLCHSLLALRKNPQSSDKSKSIRLDGHSFKMLAIALDGKPLNSTQYTADETGLDLTQLPDACVLEITTELLPQHNTALEGLYRSSGNFCTQCEAEGFRRITYFLDRPDVLSRYRVMITADKSRYPVLLSNGNLLSSRDGDNGTHTVTWEDPHPKPCYLFALVAGNLASVTDRYNTVEGREVVLNIYTEQHNISRCTHAMASLKHSMKWDEDVYGLSYDLDVFNIVAVDDFNMGAMENKGLNIFNSKYVLADQQTATDSDFQNIEAIIAHEYFHNWSGNRVTCRDWFQLSLKEGLTVFRDQEFSADRNSRSVKRIEDVRLLRARQFPEDAGPMAHPVRPESYIEINNFYTVTIYEKGAELIRMMHTLLGAKKYRAGLDLYFERHDGQAVTCEDFVRALEDANGVDLKQFRRWYSQSGTPSLYVSSQYDQAKQQLRLNFEQNIMPTETQPEPQPMHIPVRLGLLRHDGSAQALLLQGEAVEVGYECVLDIKEKRQSFVFEAVDQPVMPSLLRGFSAPVRLNFDYSDSDLSFLITHDSDSYNRWEAAQQLISRVVKRNAEALRNDEQLELPESLLDGIRQLLTDQKQDSALRAEALDIPSEESVAEGEQLIQIDSLNTSRRWMIEQCGSELQQELLANFEALTVTEFSIDASAIGARRLKNLCLEWLVAANPEQHGHLAAAQYKNANNMTDSLAALRCLVDTNLAVRDELLADFYDRWKDERLVMDKWFSLQAASQRDDVLEAVKQLHQHPLFTIENPNRVRSVVGAFCGLNSVHFHAQDGSGYRYLADFLMQYDNINPQVAARLCTALSRWARFDDTRQQHTKDALRQILASDSLSRDTYEIAFKALGSD